MASCHIISRSWEDALVYLNSIKPYCEKDPVRNRIGLPHPLPAPGSGRLTAAGQVFNYNIGVALAASGKVGRTSNAYRAWVDACVRRAVRRGGRRVAEGGPGVR